MQITQEIIQKIDDKVNEIAPRLSDRDKERYKEYLELNYMIQECTPPALYAHDYYLKLALDDYSDRATKKGYKKIFGAKATHFFRDKVLVKRLSDTEIILYKNATKYRSQFGALIIMVKEFKTPRGIHFIVTNEGSEDDLVFSSHFIDRFQARLLEVNKVKKSREEAIALVSDLMTKECYKHQIMGHNEKIVIDASLELYLEVGMAIGKTFPKKRGGTIDYLRTFIPLDMMHRDQLERHAKAYMTNKNSLFEIKKDF
jgi:hypothetical protein